MTTFALVAASDFNREDYLCRQLAGEFDCVIAVDRGYAHLETVGVAPDVVLGDFDSLGYVPDHPCVVRHPELKDASDLELALDYARVRGADAVVAYGCLGGRLDHTLAALQNLAAAAEEGLDVTAIGCGVQDAKAHYEEGFALRILVGPAVAEFATTPDGPLTGGLSVFSLTDISRGVAEEGLFYPLVDAELTNRTSLGLSNQFTGAPARVSVREGTLCLLYPAALECVVIDGASE